MGTPSAGPESVTSKVKPSLVKLVIGTGATVVVVAGANGSKWEQNGALARWTKKEGHSMRIRWVLLLYVVAEIAAFAGLAHWLGVGWALLITLLAGVAGTRSRRAWQPCDPRPGESCAQRDPANPTTARHGAAGPLDGACDPSGHRDHGARCAAHGAAGACSCSPGRDRVRGTTVGHAVVSVVGARTVFLGGDVIDGEVVDVPVAVPTEQRQLPPAH